MDKQTADYYKKRQLEDAAARAAMNKQTATAAAAATNTVANNPIAVNPYGTTVGKYASYSSGTIPNYNSKYDTKAENMLTLYKNNVPYKDPYAKQYSKALSNVLNPEDYNGQWDANINKYLGLLEQDYDPNSDANYIAYKNQYLAGGQKAMQDTLAQAAALTGGYGSSYGQSAAQQTYGEYTAALANKIPELAAAARQMYLDNLNVYMGLDERDYGRYRDKIGDSYNILSAIQGASDTAYGRHQDKLGNIYNLYSGYSGLADRDYSRFKDEYSMWNSAMSDLTKGSGGSGGRSGSGKSSNNNADLIKELQYANKKGASIGDMLAYAQDEINNGAEVVMPGTNQALPQGAGMEYVRSQLQSLLNKRNSKK